MPVLGHAFVGMATAMAAAPRGGVPRRAFLWVPTMVALAYLPDIAKQFLGLLGVQTLRYLAHSVVLSLPIAALLTPVLLWLFGLGWLRCFLVALASVSIHCGLDELFGERYMFLWPLSAERGRLALPPHELGKAVELLIFPTGFVVFYFAWRGLHRSGDGRSGARLWVGDTAGQRWGAAALTGVLLFAAGTTYGLGLLRAYQGRLVWKLSNEGRYDAALHYLELSSRWPAGYHPAQELCVRGGIYLKMGDRARAEDAWLKSYAADPSYYWTVAALAGFYANADAPLDWRREKARPYMEKLRSEFAIEPRAPQTWERLARKLEWTAADQK